ncbi:hypothetical protein OK016_14490 [Vibrio chagasii]|nr:hypothetical protein [Vibrio chagasii]
MRGNGIDVHQQFFNALEHLQKEGVSLTYPMVRRKPRDHLGYEVLFLHQHHFIDFYQ